MGTSFGSGHKSQIAMAACSNHLDSSVESTDKAPVGCLSYEFKILLNSAILNSPDQSIWSFHDLLIEKASEVNSDESDCIEKMVCVGDRVVPIMSWEMALIKDSAKKSFGFPSMS